MNEHKMMAPKDAKPDELRMMKVSDGHAYIWRGDEWICTARAELAEKIVAWLKQEQSR